MSVEKPFIDSIGFTGHLGELLITAWLAANITSLMVEFLVPS